MPNWVQNVVEISGDPVEIKRLVEYVDSKDITDEDATFDFNRIIPMPKCIENTEAGSKNTDAICYYLTNRFFKEPEDCPKLSEVLALDRPFLFGKYSNNASLYCERANEYVRRLSSQAERDELFRYGKQLVENFDKYGTLDWYSWRCSNWGTKWNSNDVTREYDDGADHAKYYFTTAWSMPYGVFEKLVSDFPNLEFHGKYADEDMGNNCGAWDGLLGVFSQYEPFDDTPEGALKFACEVWDYDYDDYLREYADEDNDG